MDKTLIIKHFSIKMKILLFVNNLCIKLNPLGFAYL